MSELLDTVVYMPQENFQIMNNTRGKSIKLAKDLTSQVLLDRGRSVKTALTLVKRDILEELCYVRSSRKTLIREIEGKNVSYHIGIFEEDTDERDR